MDIFRIALSRVANVSLEGPVDLSTESRLTGALPDPHAVDRVVIDLTKVSYFDSFALGKLVAFRREFCAGGGDPHALVLVLPQQGPVRRIFEMTGLAKLFDIEDSASSVAGEPGQPG